MKKVLYEQDAADAIRDDISETNLLLAEIWKDILKEILEIRRKLTKNALYELDPNRDYTQNSLSFLVKVLLEQQKDNSFSAIDQRLKLQELINAELDRLNKYLRSDTQCPYCPDQHAYFACSRYRAAQDED